MEILSGGRLKTQRKFGLARDRAPEGASQEAVCFSEIPPGQWRRLEERRETKYGIGFTKEFILSKGGAPIWYAWKDTAHWRALQAMMSQSAGDNSAPIWRLTPMIDAPGIYRSAPYIFDWEREWRHIGHFDFEPADVAFLLIPEHLHESAHGFFENARDENLCPAYFCTYIDPSWDRDRIVAALRTN